MIQRVSHSSKGVKLWDLEPFWKVQNQVDAQIFIVKSGGIRDALELLHGFLDLFFYVDLLLFLCPPFLFLFLIMVQLRTMHIVLGRDGNLKLQTEFECFGRFGNSAGRLEDWCSDLSGGGVFGDGKYFGFDFGFNFAVEEQFDGRCFEDGVEFGDGCF